jgi:hypothetical protein
MKIAKITKCTRVPVSATANAQLDSGGRFFLNLTNKKNNTNITNIIYKCWSIKFNESLYFLMDKTLIYPGPTW